MNKTVEEIWEEVYEHWSKNKNNLSEEEAERFLFYAAELDHKRRYQGALEFDGIDGPSWEELTEEQRENIRKVNNDHFKAMNELGNSLSGA